MPRRHSMRASGRSQVSRTKRASHCAVACIFPKSSFSTVSSGVWYTRLRPFDRKRNGMLRSQNA